jgi:hypothetical protein
MRAPRGWFVVVAMLTGCSLWSDAGNYAPPVSGRDCGVETQSLNEAGRRCLLTAFQTGAAATFVSRATTVEGDPFTRSYIVRGPGDIEITTDSRADSYGSGRIEKQRCDRLVPVEEWNRTVEEGSQMDAGYIFVEDGCEPYST